ncbi:MAG TPA: hypothetical protein VFO39_12285 [Candidatus Sulfotelmatobacter sp.]|nr:hypothetical protein [Candidatus Sulfotelmatobacter sp.]
MADLQLLAERVNRRVQLVSLLLVFVGIASVFLSDPVRTAGYHKWAAFFAEGGAALFIAGVLAVVWELVGKRAFADEILAKANMARDLAEAGVEVVTNSFKDERVRWELLFKNACRLDIFISYGHTWRNTQLERIDDLLSEPGSRLRVVLPDPDDEETMKALASRFNMSTADVQHEIGDSKVFFEHRRKKAAGAVEIYFSRIAPLFSFYRFNNKAVCALYNHREGRLPVPTFVCDRDGFLFGYLSDEFEGIVGDTQRTRRVDSGNQQ